MASFIQLTTITSGASFTLNAANETGYIGSGITVVGNVVSASGTNTRLYNYGDIVGTAGDTVAGFGSSTFFIANYGNITNLANGFAIGHTASAQETLYNYGVIQGLVGSNGHGALDIHNFGTINGDITNFSFGTGTLTIVNDGRIDGNILGSTQAAVQDVITNTGSIDGEINLRGGNDIYDGRDGSVIGIVDGGAGDDVLLGGNSADTLLDTAGNNWIVGGGGDDTIAIANLAGFVSTAYGGDVNGSDTSGNDTLVLSGNGSNVFLGGGAVTDVATGAVFAWINGFENATGTIFGDALIGSNGNNILQGGGGGDWLVGNGGADTFRYAVITDLGAGETIADFNHVQGDVIDFARIDANTTVGGDQGFSFVTTHTNNAAGQLVFTNFGSGGRIDLYTDADNIIDGTIFVAYGAATTTNMTASDFIL